MHNDVLLAGSPVDTWRYMQDSASQWLVIIGWIQSAIFVAQVLVFGYQARRFQ